jgi:hypothetical protein
MGLNGSMVIRTKRHSGGIVMLDRVCPSHLMGLSRIGPSLVDCEAFSNNIHQAYPDTSGLDLRLSLLEQHVYKHAPAYKHT